MASILRFRKLCFLEPSSCNNKTKLEKSQQLSQPQKSDDKKYEKDNRRRKKERRGEERCEGTEMHGHVLLDDWILMHSLVAAAIPSQLPAGELVGAAGARLRRGGLTAHHPVVLVPGIVTGGLELWEGRPCSDGLFRRRLWGGSFADILKRPMCWLEHLSLDNETGLDPARIRVRAVSGLVAADYFAPGYFIWAILIENLAQIGYEEKNMYVAAYDWRLGNLVRQLRDQSLSSLKSKIELMYVTNGYKKVVVVPHSMGANYFLHFMKWVEAGGPGWCGKHIKSVINIGPVFLGVPKAVGSLLSGLLGSEIFGLQALERVMRVSRTWDSLISLLPKGGEAIWGDSNWSPEEDHVCDSIMRNYLKHFKAQANHTDSRLFQEQEPTNYGNIVSFGKAMSRQECLPNVTSSRSHASCGNIVQTEYDEMSQETLRKISEEGTYTASTVLDLLRSVAPKMMKRAEAHFSHGVADNLSDPKYNHYKYWSNPLETKLPEAPDMEIYCLYGVGIPTERSYVYKLTPPGRCRSIPLQIDSSADDSQNGCLKGGVHFVDGDESVPILSAGYMCAKGWRGKTRFNPSGAATYIREYKHKAPANLLEGRGLESGAHVDIMGNVALIEDVLRVAAGASGEELGGERIYSDIMKLSGKININL